MKRLDNFAKFIFILLGCFFGILAVLYTTTALAPTAPAIIALISFLSLMSFASFAISSSARIAALLSLSATLLLVLCGELVIAYSTEDSLVHAIDEAQKKGRPYDARTKLEVVTELKTAGFDAVPGFTPAFMRIPDVGTEDTYTSEMSIQGEPFFPLSGISNKKTVLCNETGEFAIYQADEHGFNNPAGLWSQTIDVIALGDSVAMGHCVDPSENALSSIRKKYPNTLNLGFSGNSPLYALASLKEYGALVKPKHVIWFYSENDLAWYEIGKDQKTPYLRRYLEDNFSQNLHGRRSEIDAAMTKYIQTKLDHPANSSLVGRAELVRKDWIDRLIEAITFKTIRSAITLFNEQGTKTDNRVREERENFYRLIVENAISLVNSWNGKFYIVYMPGVDELSKETPTNEYSFVVALAEEANVPLIDVYIKMSEKPEPTIFYSLPQRSAALLPHMNRAGYKIVSETLLQAIESKIEIDEF